MNLLNLKSSRAQTVDFQKFQMIDAQLPSPRYTNYESYLKSITEIDWVYSCVSLLAYTIGKNRFGIYKRGTEEEIDKHPFIDLLNSPNEYQTYFEFIEEVIIYLKLTGNAFIALEEINTYGQPKTIYALRPSRVKIMPAKEKRVAGYVYSLNQIKVPYAENEILHLRYANPNDDYYGLGIIEAGENTFNIEYSQQQALLSFFKNGARPSGILTTDQIIKDEGVFKLILKKWNEAHQGAKNKYKTALLAAGTKYQSISVDPGTSTHSQLSKDSRDRILAMFGVPKQKLGIYDQADYKSEQADKFFYTETIKPDLERIQDKWNWWLKKVNWGDIEFRYDFVDFDDKQKKLEMAKIAASTYAFTINQILALAGEEPIGDEGDVIMGPMNMMELVRVREKALPVEIRVSAKAKKKAIIAKTIYTHKLKLQNQLIKLYQPKIEKFFKVQAKEIKDKAESIKNKSDLTVNSVFDREKADEELIKTMRPFYELIVDETSKFLHTLLTEDKKAFQFEDAEWLFPNKDKFVDKMCKKVVTINETTAKDLGKVINEGHNRKYSIYQIINGYPKENYGGMMDKLAEGWEYRAERIARTETMMVYNEASVETYKEAGMEKVELMDALIDPNCSECQERNGLVVLAVDADAYIDEEHPNGSLTVLPYFE